MNLPSVPPKPLASDLGEAMEFIRNVPFFADIEASELAKIVRVGVRKKYKKGSIILLEEETGAALFVIIAGKVKIVRTDDDGREVILSILGENDFFGEMSLLTGEPRTASVIAEEETEVLQIKKEALKPILENNPQLVQSIYELIEERREILANQEQSIIEESIHAGTGALGSIKRFFGLK